MIGGEHLVSLPAIKACHEKYPDLHVIHFDAHTDLREDYMGEPLSHSSVIRRAWDFLGDGRINQFGIRSGLREEFKWAAEGHTNLTKFNLDGLKETIESLKGKPVYLTIDLDVLDRAGVAMKIDEAGGRDTQFARFQSDAPSCDNCGSITVRNGNCYLCYNCGNSMGCS